jgi:hypothetical protein
MIMFILSGEMVQKNKTVFYDVFPFCGFLANLSDMGHRCPVPILGSVPSPNPGAAHCWPISVHIWFNFKVNLSNLLPCPTLLGPTDGPPLKQPYGRFRCGLQGGWPVIVFCLFRHPMPYAYASFSQFNDKDRTWPVRSRTKSKIMINDQIGQVCHLGTPK